MSTYKRFQFMTNLYAVEYPADSFINAVITSFVQRIVK